MTIKNLINHLNYFKLKYKQINDSTIIYKTRTSPQWEALPSTRNFCLNSRYVEVFDYNKQSDYLLNFNPTIKETIDYIIERQGSDHDPITGEYIPTVIYL